MVKRREPLDHWRRTHRRWHGWDHRPGPRPWEARSKRKRGVLFLRLVAVFGFIGILVLSFIALLLFLVQPTTTEPAQMLWLGGCGLAVALPLLASVIAVRAFRNIATPLAEIMAAADAVAEGNLAVRVPSKGRDEFAQLGASFNRMVEELERADQQRRNLTADVAHELRTPLHIIQGNLEGIIDGVYEPTDEHISTTLEETRSLARLVEDLRTLSLAEAGQLPMTMESVDVSELLADAATTFGGQAEAGGIKLRLEITGDTSQLVVTADAGRLDQVLANLIANALRHTPPGGAITLQAQAAGDTVRIVVRDTGEGIPPENLPYIFDRFWRGDRARSRAYGSSGLGLAIAKQLVQAQNGRIAAESQPGAGTTLTITLPRR
jgi:signal transduction histidine kinase